MLIMQGEIKRQRDKRFFCKVPHSNTSLNHYIRFDFNKLQVLEYSNHVHRA